MAGTTYGRLTVYDGTPTGEAGLAINDNFKEIEDALADLETGAFDPLLTTEIKTDTAEATDLTITTGATKTLKLATPVYDDMRITPGSFDRPGSSDPTYVSVNPAGGSISTWLVQFAKNNIASFTIQLPHNYQIGEDINVHVHWTPGARGVAENGATVGWKVDYTWASINGTFGEMVTADLSDACDGVDWKHQMTPSVTITGTGKGISSMLTCNIKRTDTGDDDTWVGTSAGQLPLLLEVDFHYPIDTMGSRNRASK